MSSDSPSNVSSMSTESSSNVSSETMAKFGPPNLLGYDRRLNAIPRFPLGTSEDGSKVRERCPNAITDWAGRHLTLRERSMIVLMGVLSDRPRWEKDVFNAATFNKWRSEAMSVEFDFTGPMFQFCMRELSRNAKMSLSMGFTPALDANAVVYKSDTLISEELREQLKIAVVPVERELNTERDTLSESNRMVLDLVDPSLFPLIYGRTPLETSERIPLKDAVSFCGNGISAPIPIYDDETCPDPLDGTRDIIGMYSDHFQWLPCDIVLEASGAAKIVSYINNLHPNKHENLYKVIENVISRTIPMWNCALTNILKEEPVPSSAATSTTSSGCYPPRIRVAGLPEYTIDEWLLEDGINLEGLTEAEQTVMFQNHGERVRFGLVRPEPTHETYKTRQDLQSATRPVDLRAEFRGRLQVIVKLTNVHLTPDKPEYEGGEWEIDGRLNEHICATALLYYDDDNITESRLAFRERVDADSFESGAKDNGERCFEPDNFHPMETLFGFDDQLSSAIQYLGQVLTREARLVVYPNVIQHCVRPFKLLDASKPGHRKVLTLHLVDPYLRVPSTANVAPQQKEWWSEMVLGLDRVANLPQELADNVLELAGDVPISLEEAKTLRAELMDERDVFIDSVNAEYDARVFDLFNS